MKWSHTSSLWLGCDGTQILWLKVSRPLRGLHEFLSVLSPTFYHALVLRLLALATLEKHCPTEYSYYPEITTALLALQKTVIPIYFVFATQNTPRPSVFILITYTLGTAKDRCLCKYNLTAPHRAGPFSWRRSLKCYLHERSSWWSSLDRSSVIFPFLFLSLPSSLSSSPLPFP